MSSTLTSHPTLTPNLNTTLRPNATPAPSISLARSLHHIPTSSLTTIDPLSLFLQQLNTSHAETRVDAMRRCFVVANAIGREGTLHKLIPFLAKHVRERADLSSEMSNAAAVPTGTEEDDEILLILAEQLGQMVFCGLIPGYRALPLLPILEQLAGVEETVVRDKAIESMNGILPLLIGPWQNRLKGKEEEEARLKCRRSAPGVVWNMMKRLANADWFTAKVSACAILPSVYQFFNVMKGSSIVNTVTSGGNGGGGVNASSSSADMDAEEKDQNGPSVESTKSELRNMYRALAEDDTPMVRRGAAKHLARYVEAVAKLPTEQSGDNGAGANSDGSLGPSHGHGQPSPVRPLANELILPGGKDEALIKKIVSQELKQIVFQEVVPVYQALGRDEQDSVRLLAVSASGSVGIALGLDGSACGQLVLPVIKAGAGDLSWRVRHHLAKDFAIVAQSQGFHDPSRKTELNQLFQSFSSLLQDFEAQVRASAVENIARMAQLGGAHMFSSHIAPLLPNLADDGIMEVRSKLAQTIMDCCNDSICTALTDKLILEHFKPCLECFLNDEFAEVQLHILSKLNRVTRLLDQMDVVVQSVVAMSKTANWRVRESVGFLLPHLAEARGVQFFQEQLLDVWMALVLDQVADVRSACVRGMPKLLSVTGSAWISREILPRYDEIYNQSISYLTRITVLRSFSRLALMEKSDGDAGEEDVGGGDAKMTVSLSKELADEVVEHLLRGLSDKVVNVRMVAARGVEEMATAGVLGADLYNAKLLPALEQIVTKDPDDDCKFFAQQAIDAYSG